MKELYGKFNSQVAEQLHKSFNSNKRFLNSMSPHHFIFNMRSLINHRNVLKNEKIIDFEKSQGFEHYKDQFGRIQVKLGFHKNFTTNLSFTSPQRTNSEGKIDFSINQNENDDVRGVENSVTKIRQRETTVVNDSN